MSAAAADNHYLRRPRINVSKTKHPKGFKVGVAPRSHFHSSSRSCRCLFSLPGPIGSPFPIIADNLQSGLCMGNKFASTFWWRLALTCSQKAWELRLWDGSICILSQQLYGNLRGRPCIHEYCSSIMTPHLKFRFLRCGTCDADALYVRSCMRGITSSTISVLRKSYILSHFISFQVGQRVQGGCFSWFPPPSVSHPIKWRSAKNQTNTNWFIVS